MTALADLYLTASGRIGRRAFIFGIAPLVLIWAAFRFVRLDLTPWAGRILAIVLLYLAACVIAQRLHDIGRAGWWAGLLLLGVSLAWTWHETPFGWAIGVLLTAPFGGLSLCPGQSKFNRYGPPTT